MAPDLVNAKTAPCQQTPPVSLGSLNTANSHHVEVFPSHFPRSVDIINNHVGDDESRRGSVHGVGHSQEDLVASVIIPIVQAPTDIINGSACQTC